MSIQHSDNCVFCKIVSGAIPSNKVYEDDKILAFHDIAPVAPVHVLVIPKSHIKSAVDITPQDAEIVGHIFSKIPEIAKLLDIAEFRIVNNCGASAGQTEFHLHFHILGGRKMGNMG
ncbi:MAG: histidine triad nucleotide-binding protein [Oscillospiraceae bacterium]|jgi:histidine triad (HIT) family protein|nr:histidine triad nucleotide-binding protein [Oscillospiraceae bacterium]